MVSITNNCTDCHLLAIYLSILISYNWKKEVVMNFMILMILLNCNDFVSTVASSITILIAVIKIREEGKMKNCKSCRRFSAQLPSLKWPRLVLEIIVSIIVGWSCNSKVVEFHEQNVTGNIVMQYLKFGHNNVAVSSVITALKSKYFFIFCHDANAQSANQ